MANLIAINLTGTLYVCQAVGRIMQRQGHGKIINIASIAGLVGRDRRMYERNGMAGQPIDYAAAKAGVIGMTRDLAAMLGPMNIRVNAISPGGFNRDLPQGFVADYSNATPLGRMGIDGVDIKGAVLFLIRINLRKPLDGKGERGKRKVRKNQASFFLGLFRILLFLLALP